MSVIYGYPREHPIGQEIVGLKIANSRTAGIEQIPGTLIRLAERVEDKVSISREAREKLMSRGIEGEADRRLIASVNLSDNSG
jgi:hypothetical protein